ncbi:zinc finger protein, putative [Plasmodium reichenowi]|uniref:Zinc finger protein, putative n=1 Tax=Plasmodium reichenowi TaxID=5854 RepID=A0A151LCK3_PLARE|nr:zinc finger protein, putative [Plasmodium reichenowi]KYN96682.1 zinc finger protein, putative [Plasmodium reichenowi]
MPHSKPNQEISSRNLHQKHLKTEQKKKNNNPSTLEKDKRSYSQGDNEKLICVQLNIEENNFPNDDKNLWKKKYSSNCNYEKKKKNNEINKFVGENLFNKKLEQNENTDEFNKIKEQQTKEHINEYVNGYTVGHIHKNSDRQIDYLNVDRYAEKKYEEEKNDFLNNSIENQYTYHTLPFTTNPNMTTYPWENNYNMYNMYNINDVQNGIYNYYFENEAFQNNLYCTYDNNGMENINYGYIKYNDIKKDNRTFKNYPFLKGENVNNNTICINENNMFYKEPYQKYIWKDENKYTHRTNNSHKKKKSNISKNNMNNNMNNNNNNNNYNYNINNGINNNDYYYYNSHNFKDNSHIMKGFLKEPSVLNNPIYLNNNTHNYIPYNNNIHKNDAYIYNSTDSYIAPCLPYSYYYIPPFNETNIRNSNYPPTYYPFHTTNNNNNNNNNNKPVYSYLYNNQQIHQINNNIHQNDITHKNASNAYFINSNTLGKSSISTNYVSNNNVKGKNNSKYYRIKLCPFLKEGFCQKGDNCSYAHSPDKLRNYINFKKTKICEMWLKNKCGNTNCVYAHGELELRAPPDFFKTKLCKFFNTSGMCPLSDNCRHAHGQNELRKPDYRNNEYHVDTLTNKKNDKPLHYEINNKNVSNKSIFTKSHNKINENKNDIKVSKNIIDNEKRGELQKKEGNKQINEGKKNKKINRKKKTNENNICNQSNEVKTLIKNNKQIVHQNKEEEKRQNKEQENQGQIEKNKKDNEEYKSQEHDENKTHVQEENETHVQEENETRVQEENETHVQEENETHVQEENKTHVQEENETHVQTPNETHVQTSNETHVQTPNETHVQTQNELHEQSQNKQKDCEEIIEEEIVQNNSPNHFHSQEKKKRIPKKKKKKRNLINSSNITTNLNNNSKCNEVEEREEDKDTEKETNPNYNILINNIRGEEGEITSPKEQNIPKKDIEIIPLKNEESLNLNKNKYFSNKYNAGHLDHVPCYDTYEKKIIKLDGKENEKEYNKIEQCVEKVNITTCSQKREKKENDIMTHQGYCENGCKMNNQLNNNEMIKEKNIVKVKDNKVLNNKFKDDEKISFVKCTFVNESHNVNSNNKNNDDRNIEKTNNYIDKNIKNINKKKKYGTYSKKEKRLNEQHNNEASHNILTKNNENTKFIKDVNNNKCKKEKYNEKEKKNLETPSHGKMEKHKKNKMVLGYKSCSCVHNIIRNSSNNKNQNGTGNISKKETNKKEVTEPLAKSSSNCTTTTTSSNYKYKYNYMNTSFTTSNNFNKNNSFQYNKKILKGKVFNATSKTGYIQNMRIKNMEGNKYKPQNNIIVNKNLNYYPLDNSGNKIISIPNYNNPIYNVNDTPNYFLNSYIDKNLDPISHDNMIRKMNEYNNINYNRDNISTMNYTNYSPHVKNNKILMNHNIIPMDIIPNNGNYYNHMNNYICDYNNPYYNIPNMGINNKNTFDNFTVINHNKNKKNNKNNSNISTDIKNEDISNYKPHYHIVRSKKEINIKNDRTNKSFNYNINSNYLKKKKKKNFFNYHPINEANIYNINDCTKFDTYNYTNEQKDISSNNIIYNRSKKNFFFSKNNNNNNNNLLINERNIQVPTTPYIMNNNIKENTSNNILYNNNIGNYMNNINIKWKNNHNAKDMKFYQVMDKKKNRKKKEHSFPYVHSDMNIDRNYNKVNNKNGNYTNESIMTNINNINQNNNNSINNNIANNYYNPCNIYDNKTSFIDAMKNISQEDVQQAFMHNMMTFQD